MGVHENDPVISIEQIDHFRRQLTDENRVCETTEFIEPGLILVQCSLSQPPAIGIDHMKGNAIVSTVQVAEAYHECPFY